MTYQVDRGRSYKDMTPEQQRRHRLGNAQHWKAVGRKREFLIAYSKPENKGDIYVALAQAKVTEMTFRVWVKADRRFGEEYEKLKEAWGRSWGEQISAYTPESIKELKRVIEQDKDWRTKFQALAAQLRSQGLLLEKGEEGKGGDTNIAVIIKEVVVHAPEPRVIEGDRPREIGDGH